MADERVAEVRGHAVSDSGTAESPIARLLTDGPRAVNVGVEQFAADIRAWDSGVVSVDWRPPSGGQPVADALRTLSDPAVAARIEAANARVVDGLIGARPYLVDVRPARDMVPVLRDRVLLHAGPPLGWAEMTGPMQGAAIGAALYEGWAETPEAAASLLAAGGVGFMPCHQA